MINTVKIYKVTITKAYQMSEQGEGFSLRHWTGDDMYYAGYDDGGKEYILPEGYEVAESQSGNMEIYDSKGHHQTLMTLHGQPAICQYTGGIILQRVKEGE